MAPARPLLYSACEIIASPGDHRDRESWKAHILAFGWSADLPQFLNSSGVCLPCAGWIMAFCGAGLPGTRVAEDADDPELVVMGPLSVETGRRMMP